LAAARAAVEAAVAAGGGEVMPELIFNPKKKVGSCFICRSMCGKNSTDRGLDAFCGSQRAGVV
jgi:hypothetical protein